MSFGHIQDLWNARGPDGRLRPTRRHGHGARWKARYTDSDGRERSKSFDRKVDAERFLVKVGADLLQGTYLDPSAGKITLRRYAERWQATRSWDASTRQTTEYRISRYILPVLGDKRLDQLARQPSVISGWAAGLRVSAQTASQALSTLSSIMGAALDDGLISRNPCRAGSVRAPRVQRRKVVPWTAAQVAAVRAALAARHEVMADCGSGLGLRQGEVFGLPLDAVDFLRRSVRVRLQVRLVGNRPVFAPPKGGRERDVPLPGPVSTALAVHLKRFPARPVTLPWLEPGGKPRTETLVFTTVRGLAYHRSVFNNDVWRPARKAAGLPGDRENGMHALRHYYASVLLAGAHLMPGADDRARRAVEKALGQLADLSGAGRPSSLRYDSLR